MNDEASSSTAAPLTAARGSDGHVDSAPAREGGNGEELPERRLRRELLLRLEELLLAFDLIIYAELAALYYMDVSFFRLSFRAMIQLFYLTPKPDILPDAPPMHKRPFVGAILGSNVICLILHLYYSPPRASETTRDYLHGGIIIDFIGQHAPTSVFHLVFLDVCVLVLQMSMLTVVAKVEKLKRRTSRQVRAADAASPPPTQQDHDSEERGVLRRSSTASLPADADRRGELDALLGPANPTPATSTNELNDLFSGQSSIIDIHVFHTIREQYRAYQDRTLDTSTAAERVQTVADRIAHTRRLMLSARRR